MPEPAKILHALLIAIDDYPNAAHCLNGCINDLEAVKEYLKEHCERQNLTLNPLELRNSQATRQGIINAFDHFAMAQNGDVCLLYYSGHGSQMNAPEEFWEVEKDRLLESIVCYDSRLPEGHDLADKELGYLIWKAIHDKNVHFAAIMDCCHSGTNTRDMDVKCRMVEASRNIKAVNGFAGYEDYAEGLQVQVYKAPHIQVAAAKSYQLARELRIEGKVMGAFTYSLLDILRQSSSLISYAELLLRIDAKITNFVSDQQPQLDEVGGSNKNALFLNGAIKLNNQRYLVSFDAGTQKWKLHAGALHGIIASCQHSKTLLQIENTITEVVEVHPSYSFINACHNSKDKMFEAEILEMAVSKLKIGFSPALSTQGIFMLLNTFSNMPGLYFEFVNNPAMAQYLVHANENAGVHFFYLTKTASNKPVFHVQHPGKASAESFMLNINSIAKWMYVSKLNNPFSTIYTDDVRINLFKIEAGDDEEAVDWSQRAIFNYKHLNGQWINPLFRLTIKNMCGKHLHVKALYFGNDFSISGIPLPDETFNERNECIQWDSPLISLVNEKAYVTGTTEISEMIKVYISTNEFSLDFLEQPGLEPSQKSAMQVRENKNLPQDWRAITIRLCISRPTKFSTTSAPR